MQFYYLNVENNYMNDAWGGTNGRGGWSDGILE